MAESWTVYIHRNKLNGKVYIGITSRSPEARWGNGAGYKPWLYFGRAIAKYGWDGFTHEIVANGLTKKEACDMETKLILKHSSANREYGYNSTFGGESNKHTEATKLKLRNISDELREKRRIRASGKNSPMWGKHVPDNIKKQISEKLKILHAGKNNPFYGKKHTPETLAKISAASKRENLSEECLRKMSESHTGEKNFMYGKNHTNATKEKISKSRIGKYGGGNNPRARAVINLNTGMVFDAMSLASEYFKINRKNINDCCIGTYKSAGKHPKTGEKMRWLYLEDYKKQNNVSHRNLAQGSFFVDQI